MVCNQREFLKQSEKVQSADKTSWKGRNFLLSVIIVTFPQKMVLLMCYNHLFKSLLKFNLGCRWRPTYRFVERAHISNAHNFLHFRENIIPKQNTLQQTWDFNVLKNKTCSNSKMNRNSQENLPKSLTRWTPLNTPKEFWKLEMRF